MVALSFTLKKKKQDYNYVISRPLCDWARKEWLEDKDVDVLERDAFNRVNTNDAFDWQGKRFVLG